MIDDVTYRSYFRQLALTVTCGLSVLLPLSSTCVAGLRGTSPLSWETVSSNGEYVFVAVSSHSVNEQLEILREYEHYWEERELIATEERIRRIHAQYPRSGMYRNDGSTTPIWTLAQWEGQGMPTGDGQYLVVIGDGANENASTFDVVRIYDRKGLVREFDMDDLVPLSQFVIRSLLDLDKSSRPFDVRIGPSGHAIEITSNFADSIEVSLADGQINRSDVVRNTLKLTMGSARGIAFLIVVSSLLVGVLWQIWHFKASCRAKRSA